MLSDVYYPVRQEVETFVFIFVVTKIGYTIISGMNLVSLSDENLRLCHNIFPPI